jgi:putative hydrolase of HD superfamily
VYNQKKQKHEGDYMEPRTLLEILEVAERLKDATRHCYTSKGRHESVAEHSWMMTLMAFFLREEFPDVNMDKVIEMCIIHDLGEAFTGDIPAFDKTSADEETEEALLYGWVKSLPEPFAGKMLALYEEMAKRETKEAKVYKAIDGLEAVIQHNFSDLSTWIPREYELNKTYAYDKVAFSEYLTALREEVKKDTMEKLNK